MKRKKVEKRRREELEIAALAAAQLETAHPAKRAKHNPAIEATHVASSAGAGPSSRGYELATMAADQLDKVPTRVGPIEPAGHPSTIPAYSLETTESMEVDPPTALADRVADCLSATAQLDVAHSLSLPAAIRAAEMAVAKLRSWLDGLPEDSTQLEGPFQQSIVAAQDVLARAEHQLQVNQTRLSQMPQNIDNSRHLVDPTAGFHVSTIVAEMTAMACHLFESASRQGSNFVLKAFPFFGLAQSWLAAEHPNAFQHKAMNDIPQDIRALTKRFDLDIQPVLYAVCSRCGVLYAPTTVQNAPSWPSVCTATVFGSAQLCDEPLLKTASDGKTCPIKAACHYPLSDWFGRFIALPKVEEYGDRFCKELDGEAPLTLEGMTPDDEAFVRSLPGPSPTDSSSLFIADRGQEGRWLFALELDYFNIEGNSAGGASRSTGVISMTCLNLPLAIRHDDAYRYVAWILGGPKEPDSKDAQLRYPMRLLVDELLTFFDKGCDKEHWGEASKDYLRAGAKLWLEAPNAKTRKAIERNYGTRWSELWRLPYWDITRQLIVDPMHSVYLGICRRHFTVGLGLQDPKPNTTRKMQSEKFAFKHPFALLPPLSKLAITEPAPEPAPAKDALALEDRPSLSSEAAASRASVALRIMEYAQRTSEDLAAKVASLRRRLQHLDPHSAEALKSMVTSATWSALAFSQILDGSKHKAINKEAMARLLSTWVADAVQTASLPQNELAFSNASTSAEGTATPTHDRGEVLKTLASRMTHQCAYSIGNVHRLLMLPSCEADPIDQRGHPSESVPTPASDRAENEADFDGEERGTPTASETDAGVGIGSESSTPRSGSATPRARSLESDDRDIAQAGPSRLAGTSGARAKPRKKTAKAEGKSGVKKTKKATRKPVEIALSEGANADALGYVALELDCHPGKDDKKSLVSALAEWRSRQSAEGMPWTPIRPHETLTMLHRCLREVVRPTWMARPKHDVGLPSGGKVKAADYKVLYELFVPLCVLALWRHGSPLAVDDTDAMAGPLETSMLLTCAVRAMVSNTPSEEQRRKFLALYSRHLDALERDCPGIATPNHHLAFHIYDFMRLHGHVRNWWCFPFERLLGRMQRMGINHKPGEYEQTLMTMFYQRAFFRQSMMRTDSPFLHDFRRMMESQFKLGDYETDDMADDSVVDIGADGTVKGDDLRAPLPSISDRLRAVPVASREAESETIALPSSGVRIGGRIYSATRESNSYVIIKAREGSKFKEWTAGQIVQIKMENGSVVFDVRPFALLHPNLCDDPFASFWKEGFQARSVTDEVLAPVHIAVAEADIAHGAYWRLTSEWAVIVQAFPDLKI
ncbi:hypothetical protein GGF50DRAFT_92940 [Schizophyllum commune]